MSTLGRGKWSAGVVATYLDYKEFNGQDLDDIFDLPEGELDVSLSLETTVVSLALTYGLSEDLDLGLVIPIVSHDWEGSLRFAGQELESWRRERVQQQLGQGPHKGVNPIGAGVSRHPARHFKF